MKKLLCWLGLHKWIKYEKDEELVTRMCPRCYKRQYKVTYSCLNFWVDYYIDLEDENENDRE